MTWLFLILLFLHILCCVLTFIGLYTKLLDVHKYMMFFVVLFLPFWGFLAVLVLHFQFSFKKDGVLEIPVEKMKLDSEIYKSIAVEDKKGSFSVIPIEEALIINSAKERREIIMDVLNDNPSEYIEFLQKAGNNEDAEVVHYAVTAMVEISKENDFILQKLDRRYHADPDNMQILEEYCEFLWNTLEQNLMQGQVETINRIHYNELIQKKLKTNKNLTDYLRLAKNNLKLKNYSEASLALRSAEKLSPYDEEVILLWLDYYASLDKGDKIQKLLDRIESRHIYLSAKAKEAIAFWRN